MRTFNYVDGFNLYYRALKNTPYKWLDLSGMFDDILESRYNMLKIKYFTARLTARRNDPTKPQRQIIYLRALQAQCKEVEVFYGHFLTN